jgi:5'-deoxynucleotidase YfbR-like HD superfamily hydrolase
MINLIKEGLINKLDNIKRFNGHFTLHTESVSTHSYWVTFYCNILFRELFYLAFKVSNNEENERPLYNWPLIYNEMYNFLIRQALMHDVTEMFSSDVLHDIKYHEQGGDQVRKGLNSIVWNEVNEMQPSTLKLELQAQLSSDNKEGTTSLTVEQKTLCHNIVKLCDWLSSYHYSWQEVSCGNPAFSAILQRCIVGIRTCRVSLLSAIEATGLPFSNAALEAII